MIAQNALKSVGGSCPAFIRTPGRKCIHLFAALRAIEIMAASMTDETTTEEEQLSVIENSDPSIAMEDIENVLHIARTIDQPPPNFFDLALDNKEFGLEEPFTSTSIYSLQR